MNHEAERAVVTLKAKFFTRACHGAQRFLENVARPAGAGGRAAEEGEKRGGLGAAARDGLAAEAFHLFKQPRTGEGPVAMGGAVRDAEEIGGVFEGETDEIFLLHKLGLTRVEKGEGVEGLVDEEQLVVVRLGRGDVEAGGIGADFGEIAAVADRAFAAGLVDEDAAHALGGGGEKMGAVGPARLLIAAEAEPDLVDECGRLQGLAGGFAGHLGGGEAAQLVINEREELGGGLRITLIDTLENVGNLAVVHGLRMYYFSLHPEGESAPGLP